MQNFRFFKNLKVVLPIGWVSLSVNESGQKHADVCRCTGIEDTWVIISDILAHLIFINAPSSGCLRFISFCTLHYITYIRVAYDISRIMYHVSNNGFWRKTEGPLLKVTTCGKWVRTNKRRTYILYVIKGWRTKANVPRGRLNAADSDDGFF